MKQDSKKNKLNPNEVKEDKINILRPKKAKVKEKKKKKKKKRKKS